MNAEQSGNEAANAADQAKRDYDKHLSFAAQDLGEAARFGDITDRRAVAHRDSARVYATLALAAATRLQAEANGAPRAEVTGAAGEFIRALRQRASAAEAVAGMLREELAEARKDAEAQAEERAAEFLEAVNTLTAERDAARYHAELLTYERRLLGRARLIMDLIAAGTRDRWDSLRAEAGRMAQAIVDEIGHPVSDEPALAETLREENERLRDEVDSLRARNDPARPLNEPVSQDHAEVMGTDTPGAQNGSQAVLRVIKAARAWAAPVAYRDEPGGSLAGDLLLALDALDGGYGTLQVSVLLDAARRDGWADGVRWAAAEVDAQAAARDDLADWVSDYTGHLRLCADDPERGTAVDRSEAPGGRRQENTP